MAGVAVLFFANGMALGSWLPRLPEVRDRLGIDLAAIGLALALGGGGGLVGSTVSGWVIARLGVRRAALVPAGVLAVVLPLVSVAPSAAGLGLVVAAAGFFDAIADVGMNALGVRVEEAAGRSIMNRLHGLWSVGSLAGSAVSAGAVAAGIPLGLQLLATSGAGLGAVILVRPLLPRPIARPRPVRRPRVAVSLAVAGAGVAVIEGVPLDWSALFLADVMGVGPNRAGVGFVVFMAGMVGGRMLSDSLVDRFGSGRVIAAGMVTVSAGAATVIAAPSASAMAAVAGFGVWGLGVSVIFPMLYRLAGSHPSLAEGAGLGALTVGGRIGFIAGSAGVGTVAAASMSLPIGMLVMLLPAAAAAVLTMRTVLRDAGKGRRRDRYLPGTGKVP